MSIPRLIKSRKGLVIIAVVFIVLISIQFTGPVVTNPPVHGQPEVPGDIAALFKRACYDCHSNETKLSWFDKIAPAKWVVANDVNEARKVLNFSEWDNLSKDRQRGVLFESLNHMQFKVMPLKEYTLLHPAAKISATDIELLQSYLNSLQVVAALDTAKTRAWVEQYSAWIEGDDSPRKVKPSPNGIAFNAGYKDWVAISATERTDDGRLRIIMGNDVAVNAIKNNHTNPWPDGTAFAKVAWNQVVDSFGNIRAGEFKQVAFMVKDKEKYKSTLGWGFSQWVKGVELVPYGKNALFANECVNCHKPMKANDFVFTIPLNLVTDQALEDKVITSFVNKKEGTMSTLYGNDVAARFARKPSGKTYPPGSLLTLVTWNQQKHINWSPANVPGVLQYIEKFRFTEAGKQNALPGYEKVTGNSNLKTEPEELNSAGERIRFAVNQRASVMP